LMIAGAFVDTLAFDYRGTPSGGSQAATGGDLHPL
jgi:hypothetical protein